MNALCLALINKLGISWMKTCPVHLISEFLVTPAFVLEYSFLFAVSLCVVRFIEFQSTNFLTTGRNNSCTKLSTDKQSKLTVSRFQIRLCKQAILHWWQTTSSLFKHYLRWTSSISQSLMLLPWSTPLILLYILSQPVIFWQGISQKLGSLNKRTTHRIFHVFMF